VKGLKYRTSAWRSTCTPTSGAAVQPAARRRDRAALDRGLIERPSSTTRRPTACSGFPDVGQELHAAELPPEPASSSRSFQQGQVHRAAGRAAAHHRLRRAGGVAECSWKAIDRNSKDYIELKKAGVKFYKTPTPSCEASSTPGTR
jgi:hypothetical protein